MKHKETNPDALLDEAIRQIRDKKLDEAAVGDSARRVWARLGSAESPAVGAQAPQASGVIRSCKDWQALIPAHLKKELPEAQALLVEDHLHECVPCRRALRALKEGERIARTPLAPRRAFSWKGAAGLAAAVVVLAVGLYQTGVMDQFLPAPQGPRASVQEVEGTLFRVSAHGTEPLDSGQAIDESQEIRTAKGSRAVLQLRDGSRIEVGERTELYLTETRGGKKINLARGNIIVEAAPQREGYLRVGTSDCLVSVKGTIFSVVRGTKGSRVSVIEGEVVVEHGSETSTILPGQQISTSQSLAAVPVEREIAWSRNAGEHTALLHELTALQKDIEKVFHPDLRASPVLLDLAPAGTVAYFSLPNVSTSLPEAQRLFQERLQQSPLLRRWWSQTGEDIEPRMQEILSRLQAFGDHLGDEVAAAVVADEKGEPENLAAVAEVVNEAAFRAVLSEEVARINAEIGKEALRIVEDPFTAQSDGPGDRLFLYSGDGIFAASPSIELLRAVAEARRAGGSEFVGTPFHQRLAAAYGEGVGYLFGVDVQGLLAGGVANLKRSGASEREVFRSLGVLDVQNLIVERKPSGDGLETRAVVSFGEARRGVASWLAEPAAMGSLQFISAEANAAAAFVVKNPVLMVQDLFEIIRSSDSEAWRQLVDFQLERGINIEQDFAAPLGGEIAFALDGPVLPEPSWKLIVEVYDPARLQQTIEWAVEQINQETAQHGGPGFELLVQPAAGRVFYTLLSRDGKTEIHYVFADGYLVAGPGRALLINALQYRQTGYTLPTSPDFQELLPRDGRANFSALVYQDLGPLLQPLAERISNAAEGLGEEQRAHINEMARQLEASLAYAYAEPNRIIVASTGTGFPGFNLGGAVGLGGLMHLPEIIEEAERVN